MRSTLIAGLLASIAIGSPAFAQDGGAPVPPTTQATTPPASEMPDEPMPDGAIPDEAMPDEPATPDAAGLSGEQQLAYDAWPPGTQAYFAGLTTDRQELFWRLDDADKVALSQLPAAQQDGAWEMIESRARAIDDTAPAEPIAPDGDGRP